MDIYGCHSPRFDTGAFMFRSALLSLVVLAFVAQDRVARSADEANWPTWRGPHQDGHSTETNIPTKWSADNVLWKSALPGSGQSSPVVWGDRIFLTSSLEQGR